jgi:hypothetical protein
VRTTATYYHGHHCEDGELSISPNGVEFFKTERRSGFSFSLNGIGFSTSTHTERMFAIPAREVLEIYTSPAWRAGIYVQTPHGPLAFGVPDPLRWIAEYARLRGAA